MDVNTEFELSPYVGAGSLTFGMSPAQVEGALGAPESAHLNHLGQRVEHRSFMNVGYSVGDDGALNHIGFGRQMTGVRYGDLNIFGGQHGHLLRALCAEDGNPYVYLGFVVLLNLGFALTGFHDDDEGQLAITLFPKGTWDGRLHKMKPFQP